MTHVRNMRNLAATELPSSLLSLNVYNMCSVAMLEMHETYN